MTENEKAPQSNWFVGASYGGTEDQTPRFLSEGIWENGYEDKHLDLVLNRSGFAGGSNS